MRAVLVAASPVEPPVGIRRSADYFPELESLRGIAITLVFVFHVAGVLLLLPRVERPSLPLGFVYAGHTGVSLFFVLSAFLLSLPFLREVRGGPRVRRRQYFVRRALRILPLYYCAVVIGTVFTASRPGEGLHGLPYLFFLNAFGVAAPLLPFSNVWWSLATEVQFYLCLPLLAFLASPGRGRMFGAALLGIYVVAYGAFLAGHLRARTIAGQIELSDSLFGRAPLFFWGIAAAWVHDRAGARLRDRLNTSSWLRRGGADLALLGVLTGLAALLSWAAAGGIRKTEQVPTQAWHGLEGGLWAAVLLFLLVAPLRTKRLFCNRATRTLGVLSYSIYLIHLPLAQSFFLGLRRARLGTFTGWSGESLLATLALAATCLALSAVSYRLIERPFLVRKARLDS